LQKGHRNRIVKSNIGFAKDFHENLPANFSENFTSHLQQTFNEVLPPKDNKEVLVFIIHDFRIRERRKLFIFFK